MNNNPFPELDEFLKKYNNVVQKAQSKAIFVRGIEIQQEQVERLDELLGEIKKQKDIAINEANNTKANLILCFELCANAVKNELLFLISLKEDKPDFAWQALINAENQISLAIRNHPYNGEYLSGYAYRLYLYEKCLFPEMYFASRGCIVSKSKCSICDDYIEKCDHIKGYAYMGFICFEIIQEIKSIEEISLVKNPADKSCRIISFDEKGKSFDAFTHREIIKEVLPPT
jgi:hypothetical protein